MHKALLPISFLWLLVAVQLRAQGFSLNTTYAAQQGDSRQEMAPVISLRNQSARPIEIRWETRSQLLPTGWDALVCEQNCYGLNEGGQIWLNPGESIHNFRVSFRPNAQEGIGHVELRFYNPLQSDKPQSVFFSASAQSSERQESALMAATRPKGQPRLYPNPATEYILLSSEGNDIKSLEIYNVVGRKVQSYQVQYEGEKFSLSDLPKGMYMVRMLDSQHRVVRTQSINKYNP